MEQKKPTNPSQIPQVYCLKTGTPTPPIIVVFRLILALVSVYFMISAWDDFLDESIRTVFHLHDTISQRLFRAVLATLLAIAVLMIVRIDIDDLMGVFLHD